MFSLAKRDQNIWKYRILWDTYVFHSTIHSIRFIYDPCHAWKMSSEFHIIIVVLMFSPVGCWSYTLHAHVYVLCRACLLSTIFWVGIIIFYLPYFYNVIEYRTALWSLTPLEHHNHTPTAKLNHWIHRGFNSWYLVYRLLFIVNS